MPFSYHFLDHVAVADLAFDATGDSLQELFKGATQALMEAMADPRTIGSTWQQCLEREDAEPASLLFDWLSDLVYWKDAAGVVFSKADLSLLQESGCWTLKAVLYGEPVKSLKAGTPVGRQGSHQAFVPARLRSGALDGPCGARRMNVNTDMRVTRISDEVWEIPASEKPGMIVPARIYATPTILESMDSGVFEQVTNVACLPGIRRYALCMPDGHWGYGFPIGGSRRLMSVMESFRPHDA